MVFTGPKALAEVGLRLLEIYFTQQQ